MASSDLASRYQSGDLKPADHTGGSSNLAALFASGDLKPVDIERPPLPDEPATPTPEPEPDKGGLGIVSGLLRGTGGIISGVSRAGEDIGLPLKGVEQFGQKLSADNPASVTDLPGILHHPLRYATETLSEAAPQLGGMMAGARVGAMVGAPFEGVGAIPGAVIGGTVGELGTLFAQSYGGQRERQDVAGQDDPGRAALTAAGVTGLNLIAPGGRLARDVVTGTVKKGAEGLGVKVLKSAAEQAAIGSGSAAIEDYGATGEVTPEDVPGIVMGGATGGLTGAVAGGIHHVIGKHPAELPPTPVSTTEPTSLLALPAPGTSAAPDTGSTPLMLPAPALVTPPPGQAQGAAPQQALPGPGQQLALPAPTDTVGKATHLLNNFEGFRQKAYWDVNHWRTGYGSDTITDEDGNVRPVQQGDVVDKAEADRDLQRRLNTQYLPGVRKAVGPSWDRLDGDTQAALLSVAYNYGHLPASVGSAIRSGDIDHIAAAVERLKTDNDGVNAGRRTAEANIIRGGGIGGYGEHAPAADGSGGDTGVNVSGVTAADLIRQIEENSGVEGDPRTPHLAQAIANGGEDAANMIAAERARLEADHQSLTDRQGTMLDQDVKDREAELGRREDVLKAATDAAEAAAKRRGPTLETTPPEIQADTLPAGPQPQAPDLMALNQDLAHQQANALSARAQMEQAQAAAQAHALKNQSPEALRHRTDVMGQITKDPNITDPVGEFQQAMQAVGLTPHLSTAEEFALRGRQHFLEREARRQALREQAAGGMAVPTPEEVAQRRAQGQERQAVQPEAAPEAAPVEAAPPEAAPVEAAAPPEPSFHDRVVDTRGVRGNPTMEKWTREGSKAFQGEPFEKPPPNSPVATEHFKQGRHVAKEQAEQDAKQGRVAEKERAAAAEQAAAEQAAAQKKADIAAKRATKKAETQKAIAAGEKAKTISKPEPTAKAPEKAAKAAEPTARTKKAIEAKKPSETKPEAKAPVTKERIAEAKERVEARDKVEKVNPEVDEKTESQDDKDRRDLMTRIRKARDGGTLPPSMARDLVDAATETKANGDFKLSNEDLEAKINGQLGPEIRGGRQSLRPPEGSSREDIQKYWTALRDSARRELDRVGLKDVDLKFLSKLQNDAMGVYSAPDENNLGLHLIALSLNHDGQLGTLNHEIIHALREMNLFTPKEWSAIVAAAQSDRNTAHVEQTYKKETPGVRAEERVAELYRQWAQGRTTINSPVAAMFAKVKAFFGAIGRVLTGDRSVSAEDVLKRIHSGEIGARKRGPTLGEQGLREPGAPSEVFEGRFRRPSAAEERDLPPRMKTPQARFKRGAVAQAGHDINLTGQYLMKTAHVWMASTKDIAALAAKFHGIPSALKMVEQHSRAHALGRDRIEQIVKIKDDYHSLPGKYRGTKRGSVSEFLYDSTASGKWGFKPDWAPNAVVDPELAKRYEAMKVDGVGGTKAAKVVQDILKHNFDARNDLHEATMGAINAEFGPAIAEAKTDADRADLAQQRQRAVAYASRIFDTQDGLPYTPLKRQGRWAVVAKSAAFRAAEQANDTAAIDKMVADPAHHFVDFRDTIHEADRLNEDMKGHFGDDGYHTYFERGSDEENEAFGSGDLFLSFKRMTDAIQSKDDISGRAKKEMLRLARDFYLHSVSENSALKGELGRKGVPGKNLTTGEVPDMVRAFASRGNATANYISSLANNAQMLKTLTDMKAELRNVPPERRKEAQLLHNELMTRYASSLGYKHSGITDKLLRGTSFYTLLASPFYYVQNAFQNAQITQPLLAAEFGYGRSTAHFMRAYKDFHEMTKGMNPFQDRMDYSKAPADVKSLLKYLAEHGHLDAGFVDEIRSWEVNGDGLLSKGWNTADRFARRFPQFVEGANRITAGMAAYRLALEKGQTHDEAVQTAARIIDHAHGDYSGFNSARPFQSNNPVAKVALQFRKFQLIQASLLVREFNKAFRGASPEERAQGRKALAFISAHMMAIGGIIGQPAAGLGGMAIGQLMGALDPDRKDEWTDWQHMLRERLGAGKEGKDKNLLSDFLYKGAPYALGMDLSDRMGMGNVLSLAPYVGADKALSSPDAWYQTVGKVLGGATGGVVSKAIGALDWGINTGDWSRMVEGMAPGVIASTAKAARLGTVGLQAKGGETMIPAKQFSPVSLAMIAAGVTPSKLTTQSEKASEKYDIVQHYDDLTTQMKNRYVRAVEAGDAKKQMELRTRWMFVQQQRRKDGLSIQPLGTLMKARGEELQRQRHIKGGVAYDKATRDFVQGMTDDYEDPDSGDEDALS